MSPSEQWCCGCRPQPPINIDPDHIVQRPAQRIASVIDPGDDDEPDAAAPPR